MPSPQDPVHYTRAGTPGKHNLTVVFQSHHLHWGSQPLWIFMLVQSLLIWSFSYKVPFFHLILKYIQSDLSIYNFVAYPELLTTKWDDPTCVGKALTTFKSIVSKEYEQRASL